MDTKTFVESSALHVVVPQRTRLEIDELFTQNELQDNGAGKTSPLGVRERSLLHFGSCRRSSL